MKNNNILGRRVVFLTVLTSIFCLVSCTLNPGSVEAVNSASKDFRNIVGIEISNINPRHRALTKYTGEGVYVSAVVPKHPAELSGLKAGDIILRINATPVSNVSEALMVISQLEGGRRYPFQIYRVITTTLADKTLASEFVVFTTDILIEKIQETGIGKIS